jgi:hypothetical protein
LANRSESKRQERPAGTSGDSKASDEQRSENTSRLRTPGAVPRPLRPTRRGTDELSLDSSPVIHSSLPTSRIPGHRRQTSSELRNLSRPNVTPSRKCVKRVPSVHLVTSTTSKCIPKRRIPARSTCKVYASR